MEGEGQFSTHACWVLELFSAAIQQHLCDRLHKLAYHRISQYYMSLGTSCSISAWKLQLESSRNIIFTVVIHWAIEDLGRYDLLECIINITLLEDCVNSVNYFDVTEVHASGFTVWLPKHYKLCMPQYLSALQTNACPSVKHLYPQMHTQESYS